VLTRERFADGLTLEESIAQMTVNRDRLAGALARAATEPAGPDVLERLGRPRKLMVITEDWCGTSLVYVPYVASLMAADPTLEVRVFLRDDNPDVMDHYLKHGLYRSIPVFAFFDDDMRELARFIEQRPGSPA
jgi:hypothetical protein